MTNVNTPIYRWNHSEKGKAYRRKWSKEPKRLEYLEKWGKENKEKIKGYQKKYRENNKEKRDADSRNRIARKRKMLSDIKLESGCCYCGYKKCSAALHFHHKDDSKSFILAHPHQSVEDLLKEVEKCEVICANCHAELHNGGIVKENGN